MQNSATASVRRITSDDLSVIMALNYAAMSCIPFRMYDHADAIVADTIEVYGRLPPILICRYAIRMAADKLDAVGCLAALSEVFTRDELEIPLFKLIKLTLIVTGLSTVPGHGRQVASAMADLHALAADPAQDDTVKLRANNLLAYAAEKIGAAA